MTTLIIISILLAVSGIARCICSNKELPESISAMVYHLDRPWIWTLWVFSMSFTAMIPMIDAMPDEWKFIAFLSMACLCFVSVMPLIVKESRFWHYLLAIIGGTLSQVCVALISPWWLTLWFSYVLLTAGVWRWTEGKGVFFMECICYLSLVGVLINGF